jgi:hypothetical protein
MIDAREFFLTEAVAHARTLPLKDSIEFLRGLLQWANESPATESVRSVFIHLSESDRQLELIQTGQLKLDFKTKETP